MLYSVVILLDSTTIEKHEKCELTFYYFHFSQIIVIVLTILLAVMAVYDIMLAKQPGGDPTMPVPISSAPATTYNNPGFRDGRPTNGKIIF